ncbi:copper chaperone CopZ [Bacillus mesophilus]|uniref:Heavy-metal-associated domain-containing protein n=1 Tax=Bacillus mesophilus TaxID=1808955 RepID=A0A6M0Q5I1_9BACI|nr:heavy metal-associated domain-containing protein [Bacillus mesophilus]MBM7660934.1 copper chaperone CopZ [Bacillus mesophilus]NEY71523.1 heavy-metal-associated domain-containing protein [Bacillus mesophilus]
MSISTFFLNSIQGEQDIQYLEQSLSKVPGIERVLMDTTDNELKVEYDEKAIELKQIAEIISKRGFSIK